MSYLAYIKRNYDEMCGPSEKVSETKKAKLDLPEWAKQEFPGISSHSKSGYKGVELQKNGFYQVRVPRKKTYPLYLGSYDRVQDAASVAHIAMRHNYNSKDEVRSFLNGNVGNKLLTYNPPPSDAVGKKVETKNQKPIVLQSKDIVKACISYYQPTFYDQLLDLENCRSQGLISEDEFQIKRSLILS